MIKVDTVGQKFSGLRVKLLLLFVSGPVIMETLFKLKFHFTLHQKVFMRFVTCYFIYSVLIYNELILFNRIGHSNMLARPYV